ncbi:MAG: cytidine deaminase [Bacteroidetes bacterium]|nr:cytidine deaminase [Bacteroidota bacterium]MBU1680913.1 cytidine deaminase [Bacteroidota bacterium]MBU2507354.1 cytidine deaminase [Bacteroidota bacterium]
MEYKILAEIAVEAKKLAYAPYSKFHVGAALLTADETVYRGANIENASYSLTVCAERTASFTAVLQGETKFKAIAVAGDLDDFITPCGACRQVLIELCGSELDVVLVNSSNEIKVIKLEELLPLSFGGDALREFQNNK